MTHLSKPAVQKAAFTAVERLEERRLLASVSGFIFEDPNGNGVLDVGEVAQPGVTVFIDEDNDRQLDPGELSTVTDELGEYTFEDLDPGNYYIYAIPPETQAQTLPGPSGGLSRLGLFDIDIVFADNGLTPTQQQLVLTAADRWESIIVGDLPDITDDPVFGFVDDILFEVRTFQEGFSGGGTTLGFYQPGELNNSFFNPERPTRYRSEDDNFLPYVGNLQLNTLALTDENDFFSTTVHEMAHALGFSQQIWFENDLVTGFFTNAFGRAEAGPNPQFIGENAVREYNSIFDENSAGVPTENVAGASHWRESVFGIELMSPFSGPSGSLEPVSRVTVGLFNDLGYEVDYGAADFFEPESGFATTQPTGGTVGTGAFAGLVRPFVELAVIENAGDDIQQVNFAHRANNRPTIERLQAINVLNSLTDPVALAGDLIEVEAINTGDVDVRAADQVVQVVFWEETNGIPGLQSKGPNQDQFIAIDDPAGRFRAQDLTDLGDAGSFVTYYARAYDRLEVPSEIVTTTVFLSPPEPVPTKPAVLTARPVDSDSIRLNWRDNSDNEEGFRIEVSPTGKFSGEQVVYIAPENTTTAQIDGAAPGETLFARVRSFNISGSSQFAGRAQVTTLSTGEILINATGTDTADGGSFATNGVFSNVSVAGALFGDAVSTSNGSADFSTSIATAGTFALFLQSPQTGDGASDVLLEVLDGEGDVLAEYTIDQSAGGGGFDLIDSIELPAGPVTVRLNAGSDGVTYVDAVRLLRLES